MKVLIVSGGSVSREMVEQFANADCIIAVDKGLEMLDELRITPDHIIGDFDSVEMRQLGTDPNCRIHRLNPQKDYTDTEAAIKLAIELKPEEIIILGASGTRLDHTIANIHSMKLALENNIFCKMIDANNEVMLIDKTTHVGVACYATRAAYHAALTYIYFSIAAHNRGNRNNTAWFQISVAEQNIKNRRKHWNKQ